MAKVTKYQDRNRAIEATLEKYRILRGYAKLQMGDCLNMTYNTARTKLRAPDKLTIGDIRTAIVSLKIPAAEIAQAIFGDEVDNE